MIFVNKILFKYPNFDQFTYSRKWFSGKRIWLQSSQFEFWILIMHYCFFFYINSIRSFLTFYSMKSHFIFIFEKVLWLKKNYWPYICTYICSRNQYYFYCEKWENRLELKTNEFNKSKEEKWIGLIYFYNHWSH